MERLGRAPRAAASALLVATLIGLAGTTGISAALAVDPPVNVTVAGIVVDQDGLRLPGVHLVITEELPPDGGIAAVRVTTGADGSFSASLFAWGTPDAPADLRIATPADEAITRPIDAQCSRTYGIALSDVREVALRDDPAPNPLELVATTTVLGEICGTTATPPPNSAPGNGGTRTPSPRLTPPPTDAVRAGAVSDGDRAGVALLLGFIAGLIAAAVLLTNRPAARRR